MTLFVCRWNGCREWLFFVALGKVAERREREMTEEESYRLRLPGFKHQRHTHLIYTDIEASSFVYVYSEASM